VKITILYDNETFNEQATKDWGFSCLIEEPDIPGLLFDTGAKGSVLLHNMVVLGISPLDIGTIVISHTHFDHAGGLPEFLLFNDNVDLYLPATLEGDLPVRDVTIVKNATPIYEGISSTGVLDNIEQALLLSTEKGTVLITGCAHPGLGKIMDIAAEKGPIHGIIGGLHDFDDFDRLNTVDFVCPCHCTQYKTEIGLIFPDKYIAGGVGVTINI
jgi:7,8-dihydropterin-6-yl-methyl-4-(beta-D-ribofuranosyl)aminobenzene 5'-phosphate synthase